MFTFYHAPAAGAASAGGRTSDRNHRAQSFLRMKSNYRFSTGWGKKRTGWKRWDAAEAMRGFFDDYAQFQRQVVIARHLCGRKASAWAFAARAPMAVY
jgi:hypothetical protein